MLLTEGAVTILDNILSEELLEEDIMEEKSNKGIWIASGTWREMVAPWMIISVVYTQCV